MNNNSCGSNRKEKRERSKNFTDKEKEMVISIIDKYKHVLENKQTDGPSLKEKKEVWQVITEEYNATALSAPRSALQIKILWSNLKRGAKKTVAEENKRNFLSNAIKENEIPDLIRKKSEDKKNISKTGGGKYTPKMTEVEERVLAMVQPQAKPLTNIYDDDATYHKDLFVFSPLSDDPVLLTIGDPFIEEPAEHPDIENNCSDPPVMENTPVTPIPKMNKFRPPKLKPKTKKTNAQLKNTLYLKKIQLANMEINFKKKMNALELKIKEKELEKINSA